MLSLKQGIKLSAIIDKLDIQLKVDKEKTQEQVGADLMMQLVRKAHRAEKEIYSFVSEIKKCSMEEAEEVDLAEFITEFVGDSDILNFFKSAVKSGVQD